jgi:gamma-glutamylputrescine oxidase
VTLVERIGRERDREIHGIARMGLTLVRDRIDAYGIACGPVRQGALRCNIAGRGDDLLAFRDFMARTFDTVLEYWPRARVEDALSTKRYTDALFVPSTIAVHPLNLTLGLARACTERDGRVFQRTPALSIETRGERPTVRTPEGRITADQVVITCGGYVAGLHGPLSRATIPIATFVMATEPLGDQLARAIRVPYAIFDNQVATNYYRPTGDGRVLWGGRVLAWEPPVERIAQQLRRDMVSFYPALADARIEVAWGGAMPMTRHRLPVIGQTAPNVWYATGFGGLGVTLTSAFGRLIARAIDEGDETWRLFEAFGLPFAGGKLGRIPAQLVYWSHHLRARLGPAGAH